MLASMLEGPVNCGEPDVGEFIDCDCGRYASDASHGGKRLEIRLRQEAVYKQASGACEAWTKTAARSRFATGRSSIPDQAAREVGQELPPK